MSNAQPKPKPLGLPDAVTLLERLQSGETSAETLVNEHLTRLQSWHPKLNAATQIFADEARAQAADPKPGPLSGLPISVKECFGLAGEQVTLGSRRMPPIHCQEDAAVVRKLREAGAIIIARGNNPEMLMNAETDNLVFGRSNNPLDISRVPGGSSGGDGALVGSGSAVFDVGSDILGSIRFPAAFCGVTGFKPTSQAIDKTGMFPEVPGYADTWNAPGPMTRSVRDARLVYDQIARQPLAPASADFSGTRLILPEDFPRNAQAPCIENARDAAQRSLLDAGLCAEDARFDDVKTLFKAATQFVIPGIIDPLRELLTTADGEQISAARETVQQIIGRPTIYPGFFPWLLASPVLRPRGKNAVAALVDKFEAARAHYHGLLGADGVILLPTLGLLAPRHGRMNSQSLKPGVNLTLTAHTMANYLNLASVTVPAWRHCDPQTGLPPAVMLMCAPGAEAKLLDAAQAMESSLN